MSCEFMVFKAGGIHHITRSVYFGVRWRHV